MRIASRINIALLTLLACGSVTGYAVMQSTIYPRFEAIERDEASLNHKRVVQALDAATEKLATAAQDYAFWDETYSFIQGEGPEEFVASNLMPEFKAVENLGVNALIFQGPDDAVRWGVAYNLESEEPYEGLVKELADYSAKFAHTASPNELSKRGIFRTSKGLMLASIAPIMKSDRTGEPLGRVVTAKMLGIEELIEQTGVDFEIDVVTHATDPATLPDGVKLTALPDHVLTESALASITGEPLAIIRVRSSRSVSQTGNEAIRSAVVLMAIAALLATLFLWAYLKHTVSARLDHLKDHIATAAESGPVRHTDATARKDEIGELALSFNTMASHVNQLRDQLAENAYKSGLSDWAAGTLHNVRNGIAPATAAAWRIEKQYDEAWLKNVEAALSQHADAETPPGRKEKLNTFLIGSVERMLNAAKQSTEMADTINDAARSIVDMATEFERYAHRNSELETVDLLPLIRSTAASTVSVLDKQCELVLPDASTKVASNSIVLRQIIANVLINAAESIANTDRPGRIVVSIGDAPGREGFTAVVISDNGEGLSEEMRVGAFRRRVSTRTHKIGGLGLHWCANAAKMLGGRIAIGSDGPGLGAKVTIELPKRQPDIMRAA